MKKFLYTPLIEFDIDANLFALFIIQSFLKMADFYFVQVFAYMIHGPTPVFQNFPQFQFPAFFKSIKSGKYNANKHFIDRTFHRQDIS